MTMLLGYAEVPLDYADKKQMLLDNRIALWDVLGYCEREGSLDSDITCEQPNDLAGFLQNHPQIHTMEAKLPPPLKNIPDSSICRGLLCIPCLLPARPMPAGA